MKKAQDVRKSHFNQPKNNFYFKKTPYVNPFIGTGGHDHTFPGATAPFGMMQLSPDTRYDGWDGCSGYHFSDSIIYGFSHTHLSGTGVSDYGDLLIVPQIGEPNFLPGYENENGYGAKFSHSNERASPGYYEVKLEQPNVNVRLTVNKRSGIHEYTFLENGKKIILLDLDHRDELLDSKFTIIDKNTLSGYRISKSWAKEQHFYFYISIDVPFKKSIHYTKNGKQKIALIFDKDVKKIMLKVGMSSVDERGAQLNLESEIKGFNFNSIKQQVEALWEKELNRITFSSKNNEVMVNFYTALYHSFIAPNIFNDIDGRYRGRDMKIHSLKNKSEEQYTVFSLWDTYRATHPLYTLTQVQRTNAFINTFLRQYKEGGDLPVWELASNETECMIGYHSVSVIADAYLKGIRDYNSLEALEAMISTANENEFGKKSFQEFGFINSSDEPESVSRTLEYSYDDFCIQRMNQYMGNPFDFSSTTQFNFINTFDPSTNFMRARKDGQWFSPFSPSEVNFNYTEANSWQYSLYTPHAIDVLTHLMDGKNELASWLDRLFTTEFEIEGREQADITGLIGQYAHGNEPSHHMGYLYNYTNSNHKTAEVIDEILFNLYSNKSNGLSGNEDCGQMSSWYVLSAMGLYQIAPGNPYYDFGRPIASTIILNLENGKKTTLKTVNNSKKAKYIQKVEWDGQELKQSYISHQKLSNGGELTFYMGENPSEEYQKYKHAPTLSEIDSQFVALPFVVNEKNVFQDSILVQLDQVLKNQRIYYSTSGTEWKKYLSPILITENTTLQFYAENNGNKSSILTQHFTKLNDNIQLQLFSNYSNQYAAGGPKALIDGRKGGTEFRTGQWQGYNAQDFEAELKFKIPGNISTISIGFLEDRNAWIFFPTSISIEISYDGENFEKQVNTTIPSTESHEFKAKTQEFTININRERKIKSIRIKATNFGPCPDWHLGKGNPTWLFIDEIEIKEL